LPFAGSTGLGIAYFSPSTILPQYVSHLTTSNLLIGAIPAIIAF